MESKNILFLARDTNLLSIMHKKIERDPWVFCICVSTSERQIHRRLKQNYGRVFRDQLFCTFRKSFELQHTSGIPNVHYLMG